MVAAPPACTHLLLTMIESLFQSLTPQGRRRRSVKHSPSAEMAARMLRAPTALMQLSEDDALEVVSYMQPRQIPANVVFIQAGDVQDTDYLALVIQGEVLVENIAVSRNAPITLTVLGPGSILGEMSLLDGAPRSASCTASTDVLCAVLTRRDLLELVEDNAVLGVKLLAAIMLRMSERLRSNTDKLRRYAQLTLVMQQEIDRLMPT